MSAHPIKIEAAAKAFYEMHHAYDSIHPVPWEEYAEKDAPWYSAVAEACLDAADAAWKEAYEQSFEIACPECNREPHHACMNLGSGGGPMNHMARIEAPRRASENKDPKNKNSRKETRT